MSKKTFTGALAILLTVTLVAPAAFFVAPQRASAATGCIGGLIGGVAIASSIGSVPTSDVATEGATFGSCVNDLILIPLARAAIRAMLQQMTASTINWINGGNGTGQPSYVQNLSMNLQSVGDAAAIPFINQIATAFNSPFGPAIASSLQTNYAQQTSMAGFYAANQCTLNQSSPNINAYLAGDWSQGGTGAWFALTGPTPNNPYVLQQAAQSQYQSNVSQAQTNRRQDLIQSNGFLSWCGGGSTTNYSISSRGISPRDPCTDANGNQVNAMTPGSVIHDYTQQAVVGSPFQQLISATDLDNALGAIVSALLNQVLGGPGGLFGSSSGNSGSPAVTTQLQNYSSSNVTSTQAASQTVQSMLTNIAAYTTAWQTIASAANVASTSLASLASFCTTAANTANATNTVTPNPLLVTFANTATAEAATAQSAILTEIIPVLAQSKTAFSTAATTQTFALKVQSESSGTTAGSSGSLSADLQTLAAMPPSATDISTAQQNAQTTGRATANPAGSLTVSGGSLVDQMNLINTNANALRSVCVPPAIP